MVRGFLAPWRSYMSEKAVVSGGSKMWSFQTKLWRTKLCYGMTTLGGWHLDALTYLGWTLFLHERQTKQSSSGSTAATSDWSICSYVLTSSNETVPMSLTSSIVAPCLWSWRNFVLIRFFHHWFMDESSGICASCGVSQKLSFCTRKLRAKLLLLDHGADLLPGCRINRQTGSGPTL